jgi:hypothetical protein
MSAVALLPRSVSNGRISFEAEIAQIVTLLHESWRPSQARLGSAARLAALAKLSPEDSAQAALSALHDSSRKVVALAAAISARHPSPGLQVTAEKLIFSGEPFLHRVGMRLLRVGALEHQAEVLATLLADPAAQGEALSVLDKLVTVRLVGGRELPVALRRRVADTVSRCQVPRDWDRQEIEKRQRQRILFALRSSSRDPGERIA